MNASHDTCFGAPLSRRAWLGGALCAAWGSLSAHAAIRAPTSGRSVPILAYHRFADTAVDSMTVRTQRFEAHLDTLAQLGAQLIPLSDWVAYRRGERPHLPERAVVLTADDGHRSQADVLLPRLKARGWPITLFIYPSAISNASYAMTWDQLRQARQQTGVSIQSHTYWHPNLVRDRRTMDAAAFDQAARMQLHRPREVLRQKLGVEADLLAWPFGLSDAGLQQMAEAEGYRAAFALENRSASLNDPLYAVPRHLMVDSLDEHELARRLHHAFDPSPKE